MSNANEEATDGEVEDLREWEDNQSETWDLWGLWKLCNTGRGMDARKDGSSRNLGKEEEENGDDAA